MGSKLGFFGIVGVTCLAGFGTLSHVVMPGKKTLADWSPLSGPQAAIAQVAGDAHASVTDDDDDSDDLQNGRELAKKNLERARAAQRAVESAVDTQGADSDSAQINQLKEAKRNLEAQQETLVREIIALKKQLRDTADRADQQQQQVAAGAASEQQRSTLESQLEEQREKTDKEHSNLKLLADHILKMRQELKGKNAELSAKETELEALQHQLTTEQRGNDSRLDAEKLALTQEQKKIEQERDELITRLEEAHKKIGELEQAIEGLRTNVDLLETGKRLQGEQLTRSQEDLTGQNEELDNTQRQLSKTVEDARVCKESLAEKTKTADKFPTTEKDLAEARSTIQQRDKEVADLKTQVNDREQLISNIAALKKELLASKNQLLLKEKETQMLGSNSGNGNGNGNARKSPPLNPDMQAKVDDIYVKGGYNAVKDPSRVKAQPPMAADVMATDVMVVEVTGSRVALRSGPSPDDSELMPVGKGTRLTVEERSGEWYRVVAPNSMRAYVRADMVRIISGGGRTAAVAPDDADPSMRRPPGVAARAPKKRALKAVEEDPNMEPFGEVKSDRVDRAFEKLRQGIGSAGNADGEKPSVPAMIP